MRNGDIFDRAAKMIPAIFERMTPTCERRNSRRDAATAPHDCRKFSEFL